MCCSVSIWFMSLASKNIQTKKLPIRCMFYHWMKKKPDNIQIDCLRTHLTKKVTMMARLLMVFLVIACLIEFVIFLPTTINNSSIARVYSLHLVFSVFTKNVNWFTVFNGNHLKTDHRLWAKVERTSVSTCMTYDAKQGQMLDGPTTVVFVKRWRTTSVQCRYH